MKGMARRVGWAIGLAWTVSAEAQAGPVVSVPSGGGISLDGRVDDAEWGSAIRVEHPAGTVVRMLRDASHLYLGITSSRAGFASLCLAQGGAVHVLHASAALGAVTYRSAGQTWRSADTAFTYDMRNTAAEPSRRAVSDADVACHGAVAVQQRG